MFCNSLASEMDNRQRDTPVKKSIGILILSLILCGSASSVAAYSRGICSGYGTGRVHVHVNAGYRSNQRGNDLIFLLMISSTSTSIYCISVADDEDDWDSNRRNRYSYINYERLKEEGARGRGEYLAALSFYMGCPATAADEFGASVQQHYNQLFRSAAEFEAPVFMNRLDQLISGNQKLRAQCTPDPSGIRRF